MIFPRSFIFSAAIAALSSSTSEAADYGLDCSWPIHSPEFSCGDVLGDRKAIYDEYMDGCREHWGEKGAQRCNSNEADRFLMSQKQPQSMVNYTSTGFKHIKAPPKLWELISNYWETNKELKKQEVWGMGNIYTNNWAAPTYMVSVENDQLPGGGHGLKSQIWEAARPTIEAWTGMKLRPTSQYGIRVYTEGAILAPHVDRLPLVSSCIINVAQDVDEDWVLEVYDRHDNAVNVTMAPGDMVLYESGSLVHGRPFPMKGRFFANIFIHFEPTGEHLYDDGRDDVDDFYPPYIMPNSPWLESWARQNPNGWRKTSPSAAAFTHPLKGHAAAATGDVAALDRLAVQDTKALHAKDSNGWTPLHEAARAGHLDAVKLLVEKHKVDMNFITNDGKGSSPYFIATQSNSPDHPVALYLKSMGAVYQGPEL